MSPMTDSDIYILMLSHIFARVAELAIGITLTSNPADSIMKKTIGKDTHGERKESM